MDITQLILDDHHEQRRLFAILEQIDPADTGILEAIWARLSAFLEVHAAAEEEIFYPELLRVGLSAGGAAGAEAETLDAIHDHNDIRDAIAAVAGHQGAGSHDSAVDSGARVPGRSSVTRPAAAIGPSRVPPR